VDRSHGQHVDRHDREPGHGGNGSCRDKRFSRQSKRCTPVVKSAQAKPRALKDATCIPFLSHDKTVFHGITFLDVIPAGSEKVD